MDRDRLVLANRLTFYLLKPSTLTRLARWIPAPAPGERLRILDVGCGNHSVRFLRAQFPGCYYVGLDRESYNNSPEDLAMMDEYHLIDLADSLPTGLPARSFDVLVLAHVLEHLPPRGDLLAELVSKVRDGGIVYVAHPHATSASFPHRRGTLNFYDDTTHITLLAPGEIAGQLRDLGCRILAAGRGHLARNLLTMPVRLAVAGMTGSPTGPALWDLYGFEAYVIAQVTVRRSVG